MITIPNNSLVGMDEHKFHVGFLLPTDPIAFRAMVDRFDVIPIRFPITDRSKNDRQHATMIQSCYRAAQHEI
jgi:hypothetical protein